MTEEPAGVASASPCVLWGHSSPLCCSPTPQRWVLEFWSRVCGCSDEGEVGRVKWDAAVCPKWMGGRESVEASHPQELGAPGDRD